MGNSKESNSPVTWRDKPIADKLMYIPKDDAQNYLFCRLKLVIESLEQWAVNLMNKLIKIQYSSQSC